MEILKIKVKNDCYEIRHTKKYLRYCDKNNLKIKFEGTDDYFLKKIETAINIKDIRKRYNYLYDEVCNYIDEKYRTCNYCDFRDNVCIYYRHKNEMEHKNGCCEQGFRGGMCEHLKNNTCSIKSISCKLYSCPLLRKNKVNFKINKIPFIKYFFNIKQKYYIKYSFFKDKDYVIDKLINNR